jgi:hypothetical protein
MDWVPFIVKWTAKIAPKRSHLTAGEKIWGDLVLQIRFSEIRCMNLFSAESRSIAFLHYEIINRSNWTVRRSIHFYVDRSTWTVGRSIYFSHYKIIDRSIILSQIFTRFSTYITKLLDRLNNRSIDRFRLRLLIRVRFLNRTIDFKTLNNRSIDLIIDRSN